MSAVCGDFGESTSQPDYSGVLQCVCGGGNAGSPLGSAATFVLAVHWPLTSAEGSLLAAKACCRLFGLHQPDSPGPSSLLVCFWLASAEASIVPMAQPACLALQTHPCLPQSLAWSCVDPPRRLRNHGNFDARPSPHGNWLHKTGRTARSLRRTTLEQVFEIWEASCLRGRSPPPYLRQGAAGIPNSRCRPP